MSGEGRLIYNAIRCPDGHVLVSRDVHDYKAYIDKTNGDEYMVDGGLSYLRRNVNKESFEELSVCDDSPHEEIREVFDWGTRGIDGTEQLTWVTLANMSSDHIQAILDTQLQVPEWRRQIFTNELLYRDNKEVSNGEETTSGDSIQ